MKKTILVLDDDISIRTLLDLFLRKDYQVVTKKDGLEAMLWLEKGNLPDLIISDINMPRLNGYDFLSNIKKSGFFRAIPVIMLSGISNEEEQAKIIQLGASGYVIKPFNPTELLEKIDKLLNTQSEPKEEIL